METSTIQRPAVSKSKPVEDINEIQEDPVEKEELDNPIVIDEPMTNVQNKSTTLLQNWREFFTPKGQQRVEDNVRTNLQTEADKLANSNTSLDTHKSSPKVFTSTSSQFCKEIQFTDVALKSVCTNIETIAERANLNVTKSDELVKYLGSLKIRIQEIINNINANKRNRVVTLSICYRFWNNTMEDGSIEIYTQLYDQHDKLSTIAESFTKWSRQRYTFPEFLNLGKSEPVTSTSTTMTMAVSQSSSPQRSPNITVDVNNNNNNEPGSLKVLKGIFKPANTMTYTSTTTTVTSLSSTSSPIVNYPLSRSASDNNVGSKLGHSFREKEELQRRNSGEIDCLKSIDSLRRNSNEFSKPTLRGLLISSERIQQLGLDKSRRVIDLKSNPKFRHIAQSVDSA